MAYHLTERLEVTHLVFFSRWSLLTMISLWSLDVPAGPGSSLSFNLFFIRQPNSQAHQLSVIGQANLEVAWLSCWGQLTAAPEASPLLINLILSSLLYFFLFLQILHARCWLTHDQSYGPLNFTKGGTLTHYLRTWLQILDIFCSKTVNFCKFLKKI